MKKKTLLIKFAISVIFITYLIKLISLDAILTTLVNTNLYFLLATIPLIFFLYLLRTIKWGLLLESVKIKHDFSQRFKIILMGIFYSLFTPAKTGELTRVFFLPHPRSKTLPTVIWDKITDAAALLTLSILVALTLFQDATIYLLLALMLLIFVFVILVANNKFVISILAKMFRFDSEKKKIYVNSLYSIGNNWKLLFSVYSIGLFYYFVCFVIAAVVLKALDPNLSILLIFSLPILILFGNAPITISGIGFREFLAVICFNILNVPASMGFSFSILLFSLITLIPGMIGFCLHLLFKHSFVKFENVPGNYFNKHESKNPLIAKLVNNFNVDLNRLFQKTKARNVLDVGCGEGYVSSYIKQHNDVDILALDLEKKIIDKAKTLHEGVTFVTGDIYNLKYKDESYDCVIASEILEHLENPNKGIKEVHRVSKKYCLFSVPNEPFWRMANMARLTYLSRLGNTPGHVQNWTRWQFKKLLKNHFSKVTVKTSILWNIALCEK